MSYNIGPKIGIDGEREFRQQIKNINDTYKALEAETKAVTKAFEAQGDEQGKLEALSKQLNKQIDEQKKKQALLEDAVKKATAKFGENSVEAIRLRGALYDTQSTIADLESQLSDTRKQLDNAGQSMEELEESTEEAADSALSFKDVMGADLVAGVVMDVLREAASAVKDFAAGSLDAAADMIAAEAQFEQTFGKMQDDATSSMQAISEETNIAATRMQGSFTKIYAFAKTSGADSSEALMIASRAMSAAADNAAYYDRSIEEATESLQAFLKGNYANDSALGIACTETIRNTKANELYAKSFKQLTEAQKVDVLLAMVEAGNKASGALGQASRESDSWGNVMGELSEMFRQFQAEAGKPALKALTPVIKKITKAGYDLIEDIDWEKFGDTVGDIIEGAVDHGPAIIRMVGAIVASVAALKISRMITNFVQMARGLSAVGTSATAAATGMKAAGAAATAVPWGAVAAIIGAAVGYIATSSLQAEDIKTEFEEITEGLEETMREADEAFNDTKSEVEGAAGAAEHYIVRLKELESAGLTTAAAHREYEMIVEQLNELIPELNLQIDEQTGLITENADALLEDVAAWKKRALAEALQEKLTESLKVQADAVALVVEKEMERDRISDELQKQLGVLSEKEAELNGIREESAKLEKELENAIDATVEERTAMGDQLAELQRQERRLNEEVLKLEQRTNNFTTQQETLNSEIAEAQKLVDSYDQEVLESQAIRDYYIQQIHEETAANQGLTDSQLAVITSIDNLVLEYTEAEAAARESINAQIGLFEDLSAESDWTAKKVIANWESQQRALSNYEQNLQKAVDLGLDEALVQQLSDGSVESMQILDALVNDSGISVDEINEHFKRTDEARSSVSATMAAIQSDLIPKWEAIAADAEDAGGDIVAGAIEGVKQNAPSFYDVMYDLGLLGNAAFDKANGRNSPAKKYIASSRDNVAGAVVGVKKYEDAYAEAMSRLASLGNNAFLQEKLDVAVQYPDMVAASTVNNSRSVTHMGGFNIQIYQQPGESAENLAYRVMDIIHDEVAAKEAVFGAK